jgi:hypothetical protein
MTNSRSANASQALEEISFLHERKHSTKGKESTAVFFESVKKLRKGTEHPLSVDYLIT